MKVYIHGKIRALQLRCVCCIIHVSHTHREDDVEAPVLFPGGRCANE